MTDDLYPEVEEAIKVEGYRLNRLLEAGFLLGQAESLAPRTPGGATQEEAVDLHRAVELVERIKKKGYGRKKAAELAYRILR